MKQKKKKNKGKEDVMKTLRFISKPYHSIYYISQSIAMR